MHAAVHQYWIPPHVRACSLPTSTILLDLKRNRYFGIGQDETQALFTLALNWSDVHASTPNPELQPMAPQKANQIADALVQAGLLTHDAPAEELVLRNIVDLGGTLSSVGHELRRDVPLRLAHIVGFIRACAWAAWALKSQQLYTVARLVSHDKAHAAVHFDQERAIELVCIFRRLLSYTFAAKDQCLFRALALVKFLSRHGLFPTWVIGVRAHPWAAHSWVQQGSLILDGSPEQVCEFTPILAV